MLKRRLTVAARGWGEGGGGEKRGAGVGRGGGGGERGAEANRRVGRQVSSAKHLH